jgi:hypothetical protein
VTGSFSVVLLSLLASLAGNIHQALPFADNTCANERCGACSAEVSLLRADVRFTLWVEISISFIFVTLVGCLCWGRRSRSLTTEPVGKPASARHLPLATASVSGVPPLVEGSFSQTDLNEHRRGPRR